MHGTIAFSSPARLNLHIGSRSVVSTCNSRPARHSAWQMAGASKTRPAQLFGLGGGSSSSSGRTPAALIFGGGSALGTEVQQLFADAGWRVVTLEFYDQSVPCGGVNGCELPRDGISPLSLALPAHSSPQMQVHIAESCLRSAGVESFDVMINATLGFVPSGISDADIFDTVEYMYKTSVESAVVTARLATIFLAHGGMLAMLGSVAALSPQPTMLGFSISKAAVHQMVRSLAVTVGDELPKESAVVALVPEVLDTPLHRSMNEGRAGPNWTPCNIVASKLLQWATDPASRPPNSSLVSVSTSKGENSASEHHFRLIQNPSYVQSTVF